MFTLDKSELTTLKKMCYCDFLSFNCNIKLLTQYTKNTEFNLV